MVPSLPGQLTGDRCQVSGLRCRKRTPPAAGRTSSDLAQATENIATLPAIRGTWRWRLGVWHLTHAPRYCPGPWNWPTGYV